MHVSLFSKMSTEFHQELNQKNMMVINELNKQIDELSLLPLKDLDRFEEIDVLNSVQIENYDELDLSEDVDAGIKQDLREFEALTKENKPTNPLESFLTEVEATESNSNYQQDDSQINQESMLSMNNATSDKFNAHSGLVANRAGGCIPEFNISESRLRNIEDSKIIEQESGKLY